MWEKALAALVVAILQYLMSRKDLRDAAKQEVYRELYDRAKTVYEWDARVAARPDGGGDLLVRPDSTGIRLSGDDAGAAGAADPAAMRRE